MMKKLIFILLAMTGVGATAQQLPYYSQYMFNPYLLNPAVAGTDPGAPLSLGYRAQWVGLEDAPQTGIMSFHNRFGSKHGLGGFLFSDKTGPSSRTGLQLSYAYHLTLNPQGMKLAFGLGAQIFQHRLDPALLVTDQSGDISLQQTSFKTVSPDAIFGAWLYNKKFYAGLSIPQLIETKLDYNDGQGNDNTLKRHYFITGGYYYKINKEFMLEPSVLFKYVEGAPMQFDLNARAWYQEKFSLGVSYRDKESVVVMLGAQADFISAGYAYDITLSDLKRYSSGSHEIFLSIRLSNRREGAEEPKKKQNLDSPEKKGPETTSPGKPEGSVPRQGGRMKL